MRNEAEGRYRVLVIGYGNPLRGDDGLGWRAARELAGLVPDEEVKVLACTQLLPELAEEATRADRVIFIDAAADEPAGRLRVQPVAPLHTAVPSMNHHLTAQSLLFFAKSLYGHCPEAFIVSLGAASFELEGHLSAAVEKGFPALIDCVRTLIDAPGSAEREEAGQV